MPDSGIPTPHAGQQKILTLPARFKIAVCGRRFGKTVAAAIAAVRKCEERCGHRVVWWISPIQAQSDRVEREIACWLREQIVSARAKRKASSENDVEPEKLGWTHRSSEHVLECSNASRIEFHSAHTPDHLRGAGLDLVVVDEAADVSEAAWNDVIKPMLLDRGGEAFIIGTPRGKNNWLHRVFLLGQNDAYVGKYASIQMPTSANPRIALPDLEEFRIGMTPEKFRQEYDAEFIDGADTVFAGLDACIDGEVLEAGRPGMKYITGIDLGQSIDFTALCSLACADKRVEGFARFNQMDWSVQEEKILQHLQLFPGPSVVDATGNGQRIWEMLRDRHRGHVERFVFTAQSRAEILTGLQLGIAHKQLRIASVPTLIDELNAFSLRADTGDGATKRSKMGAPAGTHDDCVMALALAWWGLEKRGLWGIGEGKNMWQEKGMFG